MGDIRVTKSQFERLIVEYNKQQGALIKENETEMQEWGNKNKINWDDTDSVSQGLINFWDNRFEKDPYWVKQETRRPSWTQGKDPRAIECAKKWKSFDIVYNKHTDQFQPRKHKRLYAY